MFIPLTKSHNETHYVAKKKTKKKNKTKLLRSDHGYDTIIKFVSFLFFFVVYKVYLM